jgi:hypothetical protein
VKQHGKELRGAVAWEVWHPEGADHGLPPRRYESRREATLRAREFNAAVQGHVVRTVMGDGKGAST